MYRISIYINTYIHTIIYNTHHCKLLLLNTFSWTGWSCSLLNTSWGRDQHRVARHPYPTDGRWKASQKMVSWLSERTRHTSWISIWRIQTWLSFQRITNPWWNHMKSYEITSFRITLWSYVAIRVIWDDTTRSEMLRWEPMGTICRWIPPTLIPFDTQSSICQDMSRYSYESPLRTSTSGFTSKYSTIEYHRVPPKIPMRKICKSSNDFRNGFSPSPHAHASDHGRFRGFSDQATSVDGLFTRTSLKIPMIFRCKKIQQKNSGKNYQCDISTGNMFTSFQANRITGVTTSNSRSHWWSRDLLCVPDGDKAGDKEGDSVQPGVIWPSKSVHHKMWHQHHLDRLRDLYSDI